MHEACFLQSDIFYLHASEVALWVVQRNLGAEITRQVKRDANDAPPTQMHTFEVCGAAERKAEIVWLPLNPSQECIVDHCSGPVLENKAETWSTISASQDAPSTMFLPCFSKTRQTNSLNKLFGNQINSTTCQIVRTSETEDGQHFFFFFSFFCFGQDFSVFFMSSLSTISANAVFTFFGESRNSMKIMRLMGDSPSWHVSQSSSRELLT